MIGSKIGGGDGGDKRDSGDFGSRKSEVENRTSAALTIAIMAGGKSRRMGRDKAMIPVGGVPMLERVAAAAVGTGLPVIVVGRERPAAWAFDAVRFIPDRFPDTGPLGGLATALADTGTAVLALACDMPLVTTEALRWLVDVAGCEDVGDGAVTSYMGILQPLFAVYCQSVLPVVEMLIDQGNYAIRRVTTSSELTEIEVPNWVGIVLGGVNDERQLNSVRISLSTDVPFDPH